MPYQNTWMIENRVLVIRLTGTVTTEEVDSLDQALMNELRAHPDSTIHIVIDLVELKHLPSLSSLRNIKSLREPNMGWAVNYGSQNPLVRAISGAVTGVFGLHQRFFNNREQALRFLQSVDPTLPELPAHQSG